MQVTNHRSNVRKPEVPLNTDPVSKLQIIGKETVAKLRDLRSALASAHHEDVQVLDDYPMTPTLCVQVCYIVVTVLLPH